MYGLDDRRQGGNESATRQWRQINLLSHFDFCRKKDTAMVVSARSLAVVAFLVVMFVTLVEGFTVRCTPSRKDRSFSPLYLSFKEPSLLPRHEFFSSIAVLGTMTFVRPAANADDDDVPSTSIAACKVVAGVPTNCVSTASIKQVDCYAPPWTFQVSPEEAMARLKGVLVADSSFSVEEVLHNNYIRARCSRGLLLTTVDELEFFVNDQDKVVTFRSAEVGEDASVSDFGVNRKRLEEIRKKAGIFGVMGEGLTADSFDGGARGGGPLGQLKAFYGLQSGQGYEDIFEE
jgi:uncharacterized protein (DUF1499 family)